MCVAARSKLTCARGHLDGPLQSQLFSQSNCTIDKLLFVARDMDVVYRAYQLYAPSVPSAYVKASRTSSIHLSFERHIDHFFDWHIRRRISSVSTLAEVLEELELNDLLPYLADFGLSQQEVLTRENAGTLKQVLYAHRDQILAVSGGPKKEYYQKTISRALELAVSERQNICAARGEKAFIPITSDEVEESSAEVIVPILSEGDAIGAVILLSREAKQALGGAEMKLAATAAGFLGRQMEG